MSSWKHPQSWRHSSREPKVSRDHQNGATKRPSTMTCRSVRPWVRSRCMQIIIILENISRDRSCFSSEEHTSELQSLMSISYAVFCLKKKTLIRHTLFDNNSKQHK